MSEQLLLFQLDRHQLGIRVRHVREIVRCVALTAPLRDSTALEGVFSLRGRTVPVVSLARALGLSTRKPSPSDFLIVLENEADLWAMRVDGGLETVEAEGLETEPSSLHPLMPESLHVGDRIVFLPDLHQVEQLVNPDDRSLKASERMTE